MLTLLSAWFAFTWWRRRDLPKTRWFLRAAAVAGVAAVVAMEAGWVVTEVGRQPWIVRGHFKVEDAATTHTGVWITFIVIAVLYVGVAITTALILRAMSRRFRQGDEHEHDAPYGPRAITPSDGAA
jgi:cytochrome d ubiquinol oxidase subunit I